MTMFLAEYIAEKSLDVSIEFTKKVLKDIKSNLRSDVKDIQEALSYHLSAISNWADEVSFSDLKQAKSTDQIFVHLDIFVYPRNLRMTPNEHIDSIPLEQLFSNSQQHVILLGQPGSGKTTSMKHICSLIFHDEKFYPERFNFPIVIKFRDLNAELIDESTDDSAQIINKIPIFEYIHRVFGLKIHFNDEHENDKENYRQIEIINERIDAIEKIVVKFLDELGVLLILDGFDEITSSSHRDVMLTEIRKLMLQLRKSSVLVTSRTGDFPYSIDKSKLYEICPLNDTQIISFARKWFGDIKKANKFMIEMEKSPFADTTIRPLTVAHLCAIYERSGKIPDKPKTVYRKIINLLLDEWDEQRSVRRASRYANFEPDRKFDFLCNLAYGLTVEYNKTIFSGKDLLLIYVNIYEDFGLSKREGKKVVKEIESHTGLFVQSGYESYEFAHKSLQEYLTAEYIVKLPRLPYSSIPILANELAIAIAISSNPSTYFLHFVFGILTKYKETNKADYIAVFVERLVQEKPDFNMRDTTILAVATLLSMYIENQGKSETVIQFARPFFISPDNVIFRFYSFKEKIANMSNVNRQLQKVKNLEGFELPSTLTIPTEFFTKAK